MNPFDKDEVTAHLSHLYAVYIIWTKFFRLRNANNRAHRITNFSDHKTTYVTTQGPDPFYRPWPDYYNLPSHRCWWSCLTMDPI